MSRLLRFIIISLTLGRIKWLMRLTWVWRLIVFLGITGWLSRRLRRALGLDKSAKTDVDSAWAEALRYTPSTAPATEPVQGSTPPVRPSQSADAPIETTRSEVIGFAADGSTETVTMHEVRRGDQAETIVRIENDEGGIETIVTDEPVETIDLAHLGEPAGTQPSETVGDVAVEAVAEIIEEEVEIDEILDVLEAAEPEVGSTPPPSATPKRSRSRKTEAPEPEPAAPTIEPDWVRGDGSEDCPESHPVKAKASSMIYYVPESRHYSLTTPDVCFASAADAEAAGYRAPRR